MVKSTYTAFYKILKDYQLLKQNFAIHYISRIIADYSSFFKEDVKNLVPRHIPHKHTKEMSMKSKIVRYN